MTNKNLTIGLVIAILIAVVGLFTPVGQKAVKLFGTAVDCTSITCLTSLGVTGTAQFDGAVITNSTITQSGTSAFTGTVKIGSTGTALNQVTSGTCYLNFSRVPVAISATSTVNVDCQGTNMLGSGTATQSALTGIAYGDRVFLTMSTTTPTTFTGPLILSANASGTAGYIHVVLMNGTGGSFTPGTTTASGIQYFTTR